jgi:hypothetical protein
MFVFRLELDQEEADKVRERVEAATQYMKDLKTEIETIGSKYLIQ